MLAYIGRAALHSPCLFQVDIKLVVSSRVAGSELLVEV
jgi:hypothetical protein